MTPEQLQNELIKEIKKELEKYLFQNYKGELVEMNVFGQFLPKMVNHNRNDDEDLQDSDDLNSMMDDDISEYEYKECYPFVQVQLLEQISDLENATQHVLFFIGIHDNDTNNVGTKEVLNIIEIIRQRFFNNRVVGRCFFVTPNTKFIGLPGDDDTFPYFHGTVEMYFDFCPANKKEDMQYGSEEDRISRDFC